MYTHDNAKHSQTRTRLQASHYSQIDDKAYTHTRQKEHFCGIDGEKSGKQDFLSLGTDERRMAVAQVVSKGRLWNY